MLDHFKILSRYPYTQEIHNHGQGGQVQQVQGAVHDDGDVNGG